MTCEHDMSLPTVTLSIRDVTDPREFLNKTTVILTFPTVKTNMNNMFGSLRTRHKKSSLSDSYFNFDDKGLNLV